jgi:hypothetical protein
MGNNRAWGLPYFYLFWQHVAIAKLSTMDPTLAAIITNVLTFGLIKKF